MKATKTTLLISEIVVLLLLALAGTGAYLWNRYNTKFSAPSDDIFVTELQNEYRALGTAEGITETTTQYKNIVNLIGLLEQEGKITDSIGDVYVEAAKQVYLPLMLTHHLQQLESDNFTVADLESMQCVMQELNTWTPDSAHIAQVNDFKTLFEEKRALTAVYAAAEYLKKPMHYTNNKAAIEQLKAIRECLANPFVKNSDMADSLHLAINNLAADHLKQVEKAVTKFRKVDYRYWRKPYFTKRFYKEAKDAVRAYEQMKPYYGKAYKATKIKKQKQRMQQHYNKAMRYYKNK